MQEQLETLRTTLAPYPGAYSGIVIAALLLPLSGSLGLMALPDTPMAVATLLCLAAGARLVRSGGGDRSAGQPGRTLP